MPLQVFLGVRGKVKYVSTSKGLEEWEQDNYLVMTWLWNMESSVIINFMFRDNKKTWKVDCDTYSMKKNAS